MTPFDAIEKLDRLHAFFAEREPADVFAELHRLVGSLLADPETGAIMRELQNEATERVRQVRAADEACVQVLVEIRTDTVRLFPQLADADGSVSDGASSDPWARSR